jgi:hypothetical protein
MKINLKKKENRRIFLLFVIIFSNVCGANFNHKGRLTNSTITESDRHAPFNGD